MDRGSEVGALLAAGAVFGLSRDRTIEILDQVSSAMVSWRDVATSNGVPLRELSRFADVFDGIDDLIRL